MSSKIVGGDEYNSWLGLLKEKIRNSQLNAALKVNAEMLTLYWEMGKAITEKQSHSDWGDKIIPQLAKDLTGEFPEIKGFSRSNLFNITKWYKFYSAEIDSVQQPVGLLDSPNNKTSNEIVQQPVGQFPAILSLIPWGHHIQIFTKTKNVQTAIFYIIETATHNWSRNVLIHYIETGLYNRKGKAHNNFTVTLPKPQSDLAKELLKNPYNLDFLSLGEESNERDLENALMANIKKTPFGTRLRICFCWSAISTQSG